MNPRHLGFRSKKSSFPAGSADKIHGFLEPNVIPG